MRIKITRPYYADCAKGSIFPGFRLTTHGETGFLSAMKWPPPAGGYPAPPGAAILAERAQVYPAQPLYRLDATTNAVQQASRTEFPAQGRRITVFIGNTLTTNALAAGPATYYLNNHPPAVLVDHSAPCPL